MAFKRSCALQSGVSIVTLVLVLSLRGVTADGPSWNHIMSGTDWAGLAPENALCANGQKQSPVAIEDGSVVPASEQGALAIQWDSALIDFEVKNLGVTVEVDITGSNTLTVPPSIYSPPSTSPGLTLAQFHFHTPSEHMWNGEFFAAEVHFVHQDPVSKQRAVVGVFLALSPDDSDNPDLGTFFPQITKEYNSHSEPINNTLDLNKLLPDERSYYHLQGSLTTPPCSENILWFVMKNPIDISSSQLMTLQLAFAHGEGSKANNRPVQPLHGRTITLYQGNAASCNPTSLLPNQCFNAAGTTFVCCPGGCPSSPADVPACA